MLKQCPAEKAVPGFGKMELSQGTVLYREWMTAVCAAGLGVYTGAEPEFHSGAQALSHHCALPVKGRLLDLIYGF